MNLSEAIHSNLFYRQFSDFSYRACDNPTIRRRKMKRFILIAVCLLALGGSYFMLGPDSQRTIACAEEFDTQKPTPNPKPQT